MDICPEILIIVIILKPQLCQDVIPYPWQLFCGTPVLPMNLAYIQVIRL